MPRAAACHITLGNQRGCAHVLKLPSAESQPGEYRLSPAEDVPVAIVTGRSVRRLAPASLLLLTLLTTVHLWKLLLVFDSIRWWFIYHKKKNNIQRVYIFNHRVQETFRKQIPTG